MFKIKFALLLSFQVFCEEVAYAIAFFLDERASFITGQTLFVDGGGSVGVVQ